MSSSHVSVEERSVQERLRTWIGTVARQDTRDSRGMGTPATRVSISPEAQQRSAEAAAIDASQEAVDNDPHLMLMRAILKRIFGIEISVADLRTATDSTAAAPAATEPTAAATAEAAPPAAGYGVEYEYHETRTEQEQTQFAVAGRLQTADGRTIDFSLTMQMARSYTERTDFELRLGDAARKQDPLVINLSGTAAQLSDQTFEFDLNGDGAREVAHFVTPGSGFLVLDRNADGRITQTSELFGPTSGDGFGELAALDEDGNGWIDEGDSRYANLQVWSRDAAGADRLQSLLEAGVGAISVARLATPFELKDGSGNSLGSVRSTGVYLAESGAAGTMQQVDLVV